MVRGYSSWACLKAKGELTLEFMALEIYYMLPGNDLKRMSCMRVTDPIFAVMVCKQFQSLLCRYKEQEKVSD